MKRDIDQSTQKPSVAVTINVAPTPITSINQDKQPIVDNIPHLLGVNGTGQRKDYNNVSDSSKPNNNDTTTTTTLKKISSVHSLKVPNQDEDDDGLIDEIDESEEAINKTINEHSANITLKNEYFQYYNSSAVVNKPKSLEYWSEVRNYTNSSILSKSHRRAIVSRKKNRKTI